MRLHAHAYRYFCVLVPPVGAGKSAHGRIKTERTLQQMDEERAPISTCI